MSDVNYPKNVMKKKKQNSEALAKSKVVWIHGRTESACPVLVC